MLPDRYPSFLMSKRPIVLNNGSMLFSSTRTKWSKRTAALTTFDQKRTIKAIRISENTHGSYWLSSSEVGRE